MFIQGYMHINLYVIFCFYSEGANHDLAETQLNSTNSVNLCLICSKKVQFKYFDVNIMLGTVHILMLILCKVQFKYFNVNIM